MPKEGLKGGIVHNLFEIVVLMKGVSGILEMILGGVFIFSSRDLIYKVINFFSGQKFIGLLGRLTSDYFIRHTNNFSFSSQKFIAIYFLFYGIVNIFLVISLLRGKLWAYPVAIVFYILFMLYQAYRLVFHHTSLLIFLIIWDSALVILTYLEYQRLKSQVISQKPSI